MYYSLNEWGILRKEGVKNYGKTNENKELILKMFNEGNSASKIAKAIDMDKTTIIRFLKKYNLSTSYLSTQRVDPLYLHEEEIINLYKSGLSTCKIAEKFNCSAGNVWKILKKAGVDTKKVFYDFDEKFFDKIDNPGKAWVLGLMYTDGNNRGDDTIRLQMTDLDIVEKAKALLKFEGELYYYQPRKETHKAQYCLAISRKGISSKLTKLGCPPNKTFITKFPDENILPKELQSHFIRGCLDGDGSLSLKKNKKSAYINFTGTIELLQGIEFSIGQKFGWYNRYPKKGEAYNIRMIMLSRRSEVKKAINFIYKDSLESIRGNRKYELAQQILQKLESVT